MNLLYHYYTKFVMWVYSRDRMRLVIESLKPEKIGYNELMLHANFQVLKDWFVKEQGILWWVGGNHPIDIPDGPQKDLYLLYMWWTSDRPHRDEAQGPDMDTVEWSRRCEEEDQSKLLALIGLRGYLWT